MERRRFIKTATALSAGIIANKAFGNTFKLEVMKETVDNLVIGSGYGGAVAALRLT